MTTQMGEQTSCNFGADTARNRTESLASGRDTKAGKARESFIVDKKGRLQICSDWKTLHSDVGVAN